MPILEVVLRQLKSAGFEKITISVNHKAHLIQTFFNNGSQLGLDLSYCEEDEPLYGLSGVDSGRRTRTVRRFRDVDVVASF